MANAMGSIIITVKGKDITVANSAPSSPLINDLWLDLQNDILKAYDGTDWVAVNDQSSAISDIQETLTTQGLSITQNANGISQLITNTTIAKQDGTVVQLKDAYNSTKDTVDSHTQTIGTLTTTVGSLSEDLAEFSSTTLGNIASLQEQIDGSIMTWFYEVAPTLSNSPASDWDTVDKKNIHLGDLYYDTITGYCYRWQVLNNTYLWQKITDTDVTKALEDASKAQDTADSKRRVFTTTPTTPYEIGDLWSGGSNGDLMRCKVARSTGSYISSDWEKAAKYTDDTTANQIANNLSANYSTTTQMNSVIDQKADSITSTVSATYATKNEVEDNLTNNYYNITQISTTLEQTTNSIMASVSNSYAAKAELALKIGEDGIARISAEADEIAFESDKFSVDSTNLKISKTGVIEATGAKINGDVTATKLNIIPSENTGLWGLRVNEYGFDIYSSDEQAARLKITDRIDMIAPYEVYISGGLTVKKNSASSYGLTVVGDTDITGKIWAPCIELSANRPYIDFHYEGSTENYTSRIAETAAGTLQAQVDALKISSVTSGECPIVRSSSGVMQFSSASDSYVNYISGSEVWVCNLARTKYKVIKASAFTVSSSRRLKHNIEPMSEDEALKLQKLKVVTFDYNNGEANQRGLIAEDTYEIIPSAVQGNINAPDDDEDAIMGIGIDYSKLVPYLIKNAQIQEKRIQALEAKILNLQ